MVEEENNLLNDTSFPENKEEIIADSTEEEQAEPLTDLTEYCFIRNRKLLSSELVAPHLKIANLVQSFHNLSIADQKDTAFLLKELFLSNKVITIENYSLEIQNYWEQIKQLNEEEKRKAAIWLSRYCSDRDSTLAQIQAVFDFEVVKQKAELESVAEPTSFTNSISPELQAQNKTHSQSQTPRKPSTHPRKKPTPSSQRVNLIIPQRIKVALERWLSYSCVRNNHRCRYKGNFTTFFNVNDCCFYSLRTFIYFFSDRF